MPLAIDLYCGLGGWTEGLLAEGYDVVGFDIEQHVYGEHRYPAQLVVQDVLTLHGSQFRSATLIVASPPCQEYSYMAMPWTKAKALAADYRSGRRDVKQLTALFDACFRIQREACEAAGRHIPLVVENVRGAQKWVGRARWNWGSFYLWGDVPALMPIASRSKVAVVPTVHRGDGSRLANIEIGDGVKGAHGTSGSHWTNPAERDVRMRDGVKVGGLGWKHPDDPRHRKGQAFNPAAQGQAVREGRKNTGGSWFNVAHNTTSGKGQNPDGRKQPGLSGVRANGKGDRWFQDGAARHGSKSNARKAASALIAKIPPPLSRHIARTFYPRAAERTAA